MDNEDIIIILHIEFLLKQSKKMLTIATFSHPGIINRTEDSCLIFYHLIQYQRILHPRELPHETLKWAGKALDKGRDWTGECGE